MQVGTVVVVGGNVVVVGGRVVVVGGSVVVVGGSSEHGIEATVAGWANVTKHRESRFRDIVGILQSAVQLESFFHYMEDDLFQGLKDKGFDSPYLRNSVLAKINPLRFLKRGATADFDETMEKMHAKVDKLDAGGFSDKDIKAGGGGGGGD